MQDRPVALVVTLPNAPIDSLLINDPLWKGRPMNRVRLTTIIRNLRRVGIVYWNGQRITREHPMHKP